jgi:hypothetical protein
MPAAAPDLKSLLGGDPSKLLVVPHNPFPANQDKQAPITEPPADRRPFSKPDPKRRIIRSTASIPDRCAAHSQDLARPPFARLEHRFEVSNRFALR